MTWFSVTSCLQARLPEGRSGGPFVARRALLKLGGIAATATAVGALLTGCVARVADQAPDPAASAASTGFFSDGTDFVD